MDVSKDETLCEAFSLIHIPINGHFKLNEELLFVQIYSLIYEKIENRELSDVYCEYLDIYPPYYNGTALYYLGCMICDPNVLTTDPFLATEQQARRDHTLSMSNVDGFVSYWEYVTS